MVVAIIGILSSILLPALGDARAAAYKGVCISNQKQLNVSLVLFIDENNGRFPGTYSEGIRWNERTNVYLYDGAQPSADGFKNSVTSVSSVWYCPAFASFEEDMVGRPEYTHFAYNSKIIGGANYHTKYDTEELLGVSVGSLEDPADTLLTSDSLHWIHENRGVPYHYNNGMPGYRHLSGLDILFADGHVEYKKEKSVYYLFDDLFDGSWR